jgi:hypothetical protein
VEMKQLLLVSIFLISGIAKADDTKLGFFCQGRHATEERNRIFFHVILDTATHDLAQNTVKALVMERIQPGGPYTEVDFHAFYVSPSTINPQFYVRHHNIQFGDYVLDLEVYPLARNMIGYAFMELYKDGKYMKGMCERADYYDGFWN